MKHAQKQVPILRDAVCAITTPPQRVDQWQRSMRSALDMVVDLRREIDAVENMLTATQHLE